MCDFHNTTTNMLTSLMLPRVCQAISTRFRVFFTLVLIVMGLQVHSEGSKNLTPNAGQFGYLQHHDGNRSNGFLRADGTPDERLYIYLKPGETLYYGLHRIDDNGAPNHSDLTILIYENDGTQVSSVTLLRDATSNDEALFQTPQTGVIESQAEANAGPSAIVGGSGYNALSYTNNTGQAQDFYIIFDEGALGTADDLKSWYDFWDFSVYDGNQEKPGRLHSKAWSFTAVTGGNVLSDDFQIYALVPSIIGGSNAGYYVKEIDLSGMSPWGMLVYANSLGTDLASVGDTNGDGTVDFLDARMSQQDNNALLEYDLFLNNPDLELYPTTILPGVDISNANFYCNSAGDGGEGVIYFESDQEGFVSILIDLNGTPGYQFGTSDVIVETQIGSSGKQAVRWDGLDGLGNPVPAGTALTITGRFTSGAVHVPLWDVESNTAGITMLDVRPSTSFNLIYWDDTSNDNINIGSNPATELDGTNTSQHTWTDGNDDLVNTWSYGYYQVNTQNITFDYVCDPDGDGIDASVDLDSDNDGIADANEGPGDFKADTDGDGTPDYLDSDLAGFTDSNLDGVNDNYDADLDGIPDALDADSDNDGIPDMVENGLTDSNNDGTLDEGSGITDLNNNGLADAYDPDCDGTTTTIFGQTATQTTATVVNPANAQGTNDGTFAEIQNGGVLTIETSELLFLGNTVTINMYKSATGGNDPAYSIAYSEDNVSYTQAVTGNLASDAAANTIDITLSASNAQYVRISKTDNANREIRVDYLESDNLACNGTIGTALTERDTDADGVPDFLDMDADNDGIVDAIEAGGAAGSNGQISGFTDSNNNGLNDDQEVTPLPLTDTDGDGSLPDYRDIDSDNDGITDNREGQVSSAYIEINLTDANGNGLYDVYDPTNDGTLINPVNTDGMGNPDYRDTDADDDGVPDIIEGHDDDKDGFGDWDTNANNDISDETGYNTDSDADGLWDVFDTDNGGTAAAIQNTDGADERDWQDADDDNDGSLTLGEDDNNNNNWADDFSQGGVTIPDYLFRGDYDGDAIADKDDADSDNDGILDTTEANGEAVNPSEDADNDGIPNYRDADVAGSLSSSVDINGDGVFDVFDTDLDGTPDFLDLDSDNDGIWDAIEANGGSIPFELNETTGQFELKDPDNDGLMNDVDSSPNSDGGTSTLANPDTDGDGIRDYLDTDSDGDGITDLIEAQTTSGLIALSGNDTDGDGVDDAFDPDQGGTLIVPINTDGLDLQDYLDLDSDNDNVPDRIEGHDANEDGVADATATGSDTDEDGLDDAFDPDDGGTTAPLPNTDGSDQKNWRDNNDDNDDALTINEDANGNGDYSDDQTNGQSGNIPDYLFNGDSDNDNIFDDADGDADNDGIADLDEANGESIDPSGDEDGDGIPNFRDQSDATVSAGLSSTADSNGDGVYDVFDKDLDGLPDFQDLDSDNDGIPDITEAGGTDTDNDGLVDCSDEIYLEAECFSYGGNWTTINGDTDASNETYIEYTTGNTTGAPPTAADDYVTYTFEVCTAGTYDVWLLARTAGGGDDSFWVTANDEDTTRFNDINQGSTDFAWDQLHDSDNGNATVSYNFSVGINTLSIGYREDNTELDKIFLTLSGDTPTGNNQPTINCLQPLDSDGDGLNNNVDLDSDNDGIPDITEAGGIDTDGNGKVDNNTDSDSDGLADLVDPDNGGSSYPVPDTDNDGVPDYLDVDSDNDGIPDPVENGGSDTDNNGQIDGASADADNDGLADVVDPDSGGTPINDVDTDGDGLPDYRDLDSDNDGYPDILEGGGTDADEDGMVDRMLDSDGDGIPDTADVTQTLGTDTDSDGIDDNADVDQTGGNDDDGDGIDNSSDPDANGNGFDDVVQSNPYAIIDTDGDGNKDFRDIDSDNDGIVDVIEFGETADANTGTIDGFDDSNNNNGWNDAQESTPITTQDFDGDGVDDHKDIDCDNDGIVDNYEAQTKLTYVALSGNDTDNDGLDDAYDPNNGGNFITPVNTDGTGNEDYRDNDADDDTVNDLIEGHNGNKDQWADWDTDNDNDITDEADYNLDSDMDGLWDIFDNNPGTGTGNVTGSVAAVQDTDKDGIWDFQDVDDDNDGTNTDSEAQTPNDDPNNVIPDYLYGNQDSDGDGINDALDRDSDNDGLQDIDENGGSGIDPSGDIDGDGLMNFEDADMDGDGMLNGADTDADGDTETDTWSKADTNNDGVLDVFDKDKDGIPDFRDRDSDNDGIADIIELGLTDANQDGTLDEGAGITDENSNGLEDDYDPFCADRTEYAESQTNTGVLNGNNALGDSPGTFATLDNAGDLINLYLGESVAAGIVITIQFENLENGNVTTDISESSDGVTYSAPQTTGNINGPTNIDYTLAAAASYLRVTSTDAKDLALYMLSFNVTNPCSVTSSALSATDTDGDGYPDLYDLDADDDGITDNREAQTDAGYIAPALGDADSDGIQDVYDSGTGTPLAPVDTDSDGTADFLDTDSDDDGVPDVIEGWDAASDGNADWDSDGDNDPTDEAGYNSDSDKDGIRFIFDGYNGLGNINNIDGSDQELQDTDGDGAPDSRDTDDDADGINTSAEDNNTNSDFTDDFTQGGNPIPDYLFNPDQDEDGVIDNLDADSDNDGIPNTEEYQGATYDAGGDPFGDDDSDGIVNYLDTSDSNHEDANGDGVDDRVDQDRDGVPDFFDLDSDNDGILDGIEANDGVVPNNFSLTEGRFTDADTDGDGLVNEVDTDNGGTALNVDDLDGDGLADYLDLDSDNDGITDNVEGQTSAGFTSPSGNDSDEDGIDDNYDGNDGGTAITPVNTDGTDEPDYRDTDADNDTSDPMVGEIGDIIEGFDANRNGFSDLDIDQDGLSNDTGYGVDTDGDGLWNIFDSFSGRGVNNINGSKADLQDTDLDGIPDYRDTDDDNDGIATAAEDVNNNGIWTDDKVQGGGATPDYLFFNDSDNDRVADGQDLDGDNDGIPDSEEYDSTNDPNPFGDADGDGVFNYNDPDNPGGLTDVNGDGIWDEYDTDLDGVPNFFDLDSDNDGIPDIIEAGGTDNNNDGKLDGTVDSDGDGIFDNVDVDQAPGNGGSGNDADGDEIDDSFDVDQTGGTDADSDGIDDNYDLDVDGDGLINTVDTDEGGTALENGDFDNDGNRNAVDLDSDSDGLTDILEAGGDDFNSDGMLDGFGDTDGDGWGNSRDSDNGGAAFTYPNTDGTGLADFLDLDSEDDGLADYIEGFFELDQSNHVNSYTSRVSDYNNATSSTTYPATDTSPSNGTPDYLDDSDGDGLFNLLDPDSPYYYDDDNDGVINLFDADQSGVGYGKVNGKPNRDSDGTPNVLDTNDTPLPLDFLSFKGKTINSDVQLVWETTNEVNVSHFEVMHSSDGEEFRVVHTLVAYNQKDGVNRYEFTHQNVSNGYHFYKIREVDFDGFSDYTETIIVSVAGAMINWQVYPNPTVKLITIQAEVNIPETKVTIVDMTGRILYQQLVNSQARTIDVDLSQQPSGIYQLMLELPDRVNSFRIIKK